MERQQKKTEILRQIKLIADANGGVPPGQKKLRAETGIKEHEWRGTIWRTWGDALAEAGFEALSWNGKIEDEDLLRAVAGLAQRLDRLPNSTDLLFEASNNPQFPAYNTILRRWRINELALALRTFAHESGLASVVTACDEIIAAQKPANTPDGSDGVSALGYVYLIRYGRDYKIGRTNSVVRRARQVQIELPEETLLVHAILTDDPIGVEGYWHRRFDEFRGNGEWFRLPKEAVAAFRRWKKIA